MKLLFATQNKNKRREAVRILDNVELLFPDDIEAIKDLDPEETGDSYEQNAELKARAFGQKANQTTVADDSGLEVAALNGLPGVKSKRFFDGNDHQKNVEILKKLKNTSDRTARFVSVLAIYYPDKDKTDFVRGVVNGKIAIVPKGESGFGYDPIFIPDGYTQTFAELGAEIKNSISHRALAFNELNSYLEKRKANE